MYRVYVESSGSVGAAGVVFVEGGQGLIPVHQQQDPLQAKAEPTKLLVSLWKRI